MKKHLYIIFICSLLSIGLHLYLSSRSYNLASDKVTDSNICYINSSLNCDNTLNSPFSEFMGIPLSDWGMATNIFITFLALFLLIGWTENISLMWLTLSSFATLSAGSSLVMLGISAFLLQLFCPFCIILYLFSFIIAICAFLSGKQHFSLSSFKKSYLFISGVSLTWIITGVLIHLIFVNTHNVKSTKEIVKLNVMDWMSAPVKQSGETALLTKGPSKQETSIIITEFADFLCSYCRNSYYILKIFKASNPQVRVEYFSFPLDQCKGNSASCALTRATYCAEQQNQGWNMHELIFEQQSKFNFTMGEQKTLEQLKDLSRHFSLDWDRWSECINSPSTLEVQKKQLKAGENMGVEGTPSLFVNGKKIQHKYVTKTLQAIRKHLKKKTNNDL